MYQQFFGLRSRPFQLNPDPAFYFGSKQHGKAKAYLEYGLSLGQGFVIITGDIGAGKTTILRGLLDGLDQRQVTVGQLVTTQLEADDTLRMVASAFGVNATAQTKAQTLTSLEAFLTTEAMHGRRCLLVVDEAQNLAPRAVEELRMLSNFQLGTQALLQTFLVGQPEFRSTMQRAEMEQLRQRVVAFCHLGPMDLEDTRAYITHRLQCAGADTIPVIAPLAVSAIHAATLGVPRRINTLCDRLLLHGYLREQTAFEAHDVEVVAKELTDEGGGLAGVDVAGTAAGGFQQNSTLSTSDQTLDRIEQSLLRLERIGHDALAMQQSLLKALMELSKVRET